VLNRGNARQEIFHRAKDYEAFINLMKKARERYFVKIFAYCLMPSHFHILLMPNRTEDLSRWLQWLMTSHVRRYHQHYGSSGHIWQGRFKSFIVQEDVHLLMVLRYVEANPIRAGLVSGARDWVCSSHGEARGDRERVMGDEIPIELQKGWDRYVDAPLTQKELERLHQSVNRQSPYGKWEWQMRVSEELGLESTLRPRGRPKKEEGE